MNEHDVIQWFDEYLEAFAACGRGERETSSLLAYYGVPILFTTAGGCLTVTSADQVVATVKQQIDAMRAAGYARSVTIEHAVTVLNACSRALSRDVLAAERRRRRNQPAHRDVPRDGRAKRPPHLNARSSLTAEGFGSSALR